MRNLSTRQFALTAVIAAFTTIFSAGNIFSQTPVAHYPFSGNANDAVGSNHGTVNGATLTTDRFGNANNAYSFDGVDDFIGLDYNFGPFTELTVSAWYKVTATSPDLQAIVSSDHTAKLLHIQISTSGDVDNAIYFNPGPGNLLLNHPQPALNQWRQVTITSKSGESKLYINGVLIDTKNATFTSITAANLLRIGSGYLNGRFFNGSIDEVKIYNTALTAAQVLAEYNATSNNGLVAHYPFTGNANDAVGTNHGTVNGATLTADRFGNANSAYSFDGVDDNININHSEVFNFSSYTVSLWFKYNAPGTAGKVYWSLISKNSIGDGYQDAIHLWITESTKQTGGRIGGGGSYEVTFGSPPAVNDGSWHQTTVVCDNANDEIRQYLDGILISTSPFTGNPFNNSASIKLGFWEAYNNFFNGAIDEVKLYNTALTDAQVKSEYNASLGLVAYYPFTGNANDAIGSNHGTVNGATLTTDRFGNANSAYSFDGVDDFINLGNSSTFQFANQVTVSAWFKTTLTSGNFKTLVSKWFSGGTTPNGGTFSLSYETNGLRVMLQNQSGQNLIAQSNAMCNDDVWRMATFTWDGTNLRLFINGAQVAINTNAAFGPPELNNRDVIIGSDTRFSPGTGDRHFPGSLDDVKFYNTALSPTEVLIEYLNSAPNLANYGEQFGNIVYLNGTNNYINCSGNSQNLTDALTIEAWIKVRSLPASGKLYEIVSKRSYFATSHQDFPVSLTLGSSGKVGFNLSKGDDFTSDLSLTSTTTIQPDVWYHVAASYTANGTARLFVNGAQEASGDATFTISSNNQPWVIGRASQENGGGANATYFKGHLDEIRLWSAARTQEEIIAHMNSQLAGNETGLIGYWDMNRNGQGAGLTVENKATATGSAMNGTTFGDASTPVFSVGSDQTKPGSGNAISFDGVNDRVLTSQQTQAKNNFTMEAWVKPTGTTTLHAQSTSGTSGVGGTNRYLIFPGQYGSDAGSGFTVGTNGVCVLEHGPNYLPSLLTWSGSISGWTHIAIVYTNKQPSLYVNGIHVATGLQSIRPNVYPTNYIIGGDAYGYFLGEADEIRIWDYPMTEEDIRDRMCRKITASDPKFSSLVSYFNFDESEGVIAFDLSGKGFDATLTNGPTRIASGAHIGNQSVHSYVSSGLPTASLSYTNQDNLSVSYTFGSYTGQAGTHVYYVNAKPTSEAGIPNVGTNDRYFGVFSAGISNPAYTATYNYDGNPYVTGSNEPLLKLFKRGSNAEEAWVSAQASLDIGSKTLTATGQSTEYMLGASMDDFLAAWYPMDGNALDSIGSNHGTINGATPTTDRFGNPNKAFLFDGVSNRISFSSPWTTLTNNYSFSAWVKPSGDGGYILINGQNSYPAPPPAPFNGTSMGVNNERRLFGDHSGVANFTSNPVVSDQDWNWLVFVRENGVSKLYINGILQPNTSNSAPNTPAGGAFIGALTNSLGFFSGAIDDVKIYNKALTLTEIQQEMEQFVVDSRFGNHVKMNGNNDFINCSSDPALNITGALTVEAWVRPSSFTTVNQILQKGGTVGTQIDREGYQLRFDGGTSLGFTVSNAGSQDGIGMNVQPGDLNRWMHVAATYDGSTIKIYRNGQLANQKNTSLVISHNSNPLLIGKRQDSWHFNGDIDEVRIWNVARTKVEILNSLSEQLNGDETGLVGYWDMNREGQGQGLVVENKALATGSALNGTTNGTASTPVFRMTEEGDPGVIGGNQSICQTSVPAMLTNVSSAVSNGTYPVFYQWHDSISNGNWNSIPGAVNATHQPALLSQTTHFRREASIGDFVGFSNVVTVDVIQITGNPEEFPQEEWNIYAYNGAILNLTGLTYRGYYSASTVNIDTRNHWDQNASPSQAAGYEGCSVPNDNFTFVMKRRGFPEGQYVINIPGHDDNIRIYVNGIQVFEYNGCCVSHSNITAGTLDENSTVEVRVIEGGGGAYAAINFVQTSLQPGVIAGNQNSCGSFTPSLLTSTQNAYGGETLTITYQWQDSIAGGAWNNIADAFNATYQPPALSETTWYRRLAINGSETLPGNEIQITISYLAGDPAIFGENLWNIYAYNGNDINLGSAVYRGFYSVGSVNVDTRHQWDQNASPSSAAGYEGCLVNNDNFTFVMKRQGFAEGYYLMNIPAHDDGIRVYVNGQIVFEHLSCCDSHFNIPLGNLDATSTVEIRCTEVSGPGYAAVEFLLNPIILNYRSKASGNWSAASTWEVSDGGPWTDATQAPTDANGTITIRADHTVTINSSVTADQITVETDGVLMINSTLTLGYAPGDDLVVNGTLILESATIQGTGSVVITAAGVANLNGGGTKNLNASFINNGVFNWNGGTIGYNNVLTNNGTMNINGNNDIQSWFNNLFFVNTGTIIKSSSGTTRFLYMNVQNNGTYILNAGTLRLEPGGQFQNNGLLTLNNSTLSNGGYTFSHNEGATIAGTGNFTTSGITLNASLVVAEGITFSSTGNIEGSGSLTINNDLSIQYNITGSGSLTINGNITWISGTINRPLTINEGRTMTANGGNDKNHNAPIVNNGTINWQDGRLLQSATITNNGVFNINGGNIYQRWFAEVFFVNNGTLVKNSAGTNTFDYMYVQNNPTGTIKGIGTINFTNGFQFISNGTIAPGTSPGILNINNAQPLSVNSILEIEMNSGSGPGTGHSQLQRSGNLTLGGTLRVIETGSVPNGTYIIIQLTSGSISGNFSTVELPAGYELMLSSTTVAVSRNAPSIACPTDRIVNAPAGQCSTVVNNIDPAVELGQDYTYTLSGATTGSGNGSASGLSFNAGVTTVSYALTGNPGESCLFTVMVNTNVVPAVSISASANNICPGTTVTFTAFPTLGGIPSYQWKVNGQPVGTNSNQFESNTLVNNDVVTVEMTSSLFCANPSVVTSNTVGMVVNQVVTPSVSISIPSTEVCQGANAVFSATPENGGNPSYQWKLNEINVGENSPVFVSNSLSDGDVVHVVMTSSLLCVTQPTATSNAITVSIIPPVAASVSIQASDNAICAGTEVVFTASPVNGGSNPSYQWRINGQPVGLNSPVFASANFQNGDLISVVMTSDIQCAVNPIFSNVIQMTVYPLPVVTISGSTLICSGNPVVLTATQGASYLWSNGATTQNISVSQPGLYSVVVNSVNGCEGSAQVNVSLGPQDVTAFSLLTPTDNSFGVQEPVFFSWEPSDNVAVYDFYLWRTNQQKPDNPTVAELTGNSYTYPDYLNKNFMYNWQVVARNSCSEFQSAIGTFSFQVFTDLEVSIVSSPATAFAGETKSVSFTVTNTGSVGTGIIPWRDDVIISQSAVFNPTTATRLTSANNIQSLAPGQSYTRTINFTLPVNIEGDYYVYIRIDATNTIPETDETNNVVRPEEPMVVNLPPLPDIAASDVQSLSGTIIPGQNLTVGWNVENIGNATAAGGWSQRVAVISGQQTLVLGFLSYNGALEAGAILSQSSSFQVPQFPSAEGDVYLQVRLIPNSALVERPNATANNTALSDQTIVFEKRLSLTPAQHSLPENSTSPMQVMVYRSGNRDEALTVNLNVSQSGRMNLPASVVIPASQAGAPFHITAIDNALIDGDIALDITASATGFPSASTSLTIVDDEIPSISVSVSPAEATEGETFQLTATRNLVTQSPLTVSLFTTKSHQITLPAGVVIPAGESAASLDVPVVDNNIPEVTDNVTITASATGFIPAQTNITILDDDIPQITLSINPATISEGGGPHASWGVVQLVQPVNTPIQVHISTNVANQVFFPAMITIPQGQIQQQFNIGAIDNSILDGSRTIVITASVFISSCGCSASASSGGVSSQSLTILDNDGPTLSAAVNPFVVPENQSNAGILTITRNTLGGSAITVSIQNNRPDEIEIQNEAVIPEGATSVDVSFNTLDDGIEDGQQIVSLTVSAAAYASGSCWVMVSDRNLPDYVAKNLIISGNSVYLNQALNISFEVTNQGFALAAAGAEVKIFLSKDQTIDNNDTVLLTQLTVSPLNIGQSFAVSHNFIPINTVGNYFVIASINANGARNELISINNTTNAVPVTILPDYTATASVNGDVFNGTTPITINGVTQMVNRAPAPNKPVEVYIVVNGARRTLNATSNANGQFSVSFVPLNGEAGDYHVGACYPGQGLNEVQDTFVILGARHTVTDFIVWDIFVDQPQSFTLEIANASSLPVSNVQLQVLSAPAGCNIEFTPIGNLTGNSVATLNYTITASAITPGNRYREVSLMLTTAEGTQFRFSTWFFSRATKGNMKVEPVSLNAGMVVGTSNIVEFGILNNGMAATGDINVLLPELGWMSLLSPAVIPSLQPGQSSVVTLRLTPGSDLQLNNPISGQIVLTASNANSVPVPFVFEPISVETGDLLVDVVNEYTYNTVAAPHLAGASVRVLHPYTGQVIAQGTTNQDGHFLVQGINEGFYTLRVSADRHSSYDNNIFVRKGQVNLEVVFLAFQAITYSWNVVPTMIQDEYSINLVATFETNVPAPVVTINMPDTLPQLNFGQTFPFIVTLTNHGLIRASDVQLKLPEDAEYEFFANVNLIDILPNTSVQIPVLMQRRQVQTLSRETKCRDFAIVSFKFECGPDDQMRVVVDEVYYQGRVCYDVTSHTLDLPCFNCDIGYGPGGDGGSYYFPFKIPTAPYQKKKQGCDPCLADFLNAALDCSPAPNVFLVAGKSLVTGGKDSSVPNLIDPAIKEVVDKLVCAFKLGHSVGCKLNKEFFGGDPPLPLNVLAAPPEFLRAFDDLEMFVRSAFAVKNSAEEVYGQALFNAQDFDVLHGSFLANIQQLLPVDPIQQNELTDLLSQSDISQALLTGFINRWNTSLEAWGQNIFTPNPQYPGIINKELLDEYGLSFDTVVNYTVQRGLEYITDLFNISFDFMNEYADQDRSSVCATVTVQFSQRLTMTREAFEGTLTIFNGHGSDPMQNILLDLEIRDENGVLSNELFQVETKSLNQLSGIDGNGTLNAQVEGSAVIQFIPERGAAPLSPKYYSFGGTLSYLDPFTNTIYEQKLFPVTLQVNPSPDLYINYFMQRDIYGDDALTEPIEPMIPAELAVMIENRGFGTAFAVNIESAQPQIIENEKGVLIDFEIIGSSLSGQPRQLGLLNVDFGDIPGGEIRVGQWWFTSTLLGHFISYEVEVNHLNSFGNPDLSLVSEVKVHELIKGVRVYGTQDDSIGDFLVNDIPDSGDIPDALYYSNGTVAQVFQAVSSSVDGQVSLNDIEIQLTVNPFVSGWNYTRLNDPGNGLYRIVSCTRQDGQVIPLDNIWLTYVTIPDGGEPIYENKLHFLDIFSSTDPVSYTIVFEAIDQNFPEVLSINGLPASGVTDTPITNLEVVFNKPIDPGTFDYQDITLRNQGGANLADSTLTITQVNATTFDVDISSKTTANGFFTFTVQTAGIADLIGNFGQVGKQVSWIQSINTPAIIFFSGLPEIPGPPIDELTVMFNMPINPATFTTNQLVLTDSENNLISTASLVITTESPNNNLFRISGLLALSGVDGAYGLTFKLTEIVGETGLTGFMDQTVSWMVCQIPAPQANAGPDAAICQGTSYQLNGSLSNAGSFLWSTSGTGTFDNNLVLDPVYTPSQSDILNGFVNLTLTVQALHPCAPSATDVLKLTFIPANNNSVSIISTAYYLCSGTLVKFTATPSNGGAVPVYQWKVNGQNAGTNGSVFETYDLMPGDQVWVEMTSSLACPAPATAVSNVIAPTIQLTLVPEVSITATDTVIVEGTMVTFTATYDNGGEFPTFIWMLNDIPAIADLPVFSSNNLQNGDQIHVLLYSDYECALNPAVSNIIQMTVQPDTTVRCPGLVVASIHQPPFALTGGLPVGGIYSGIGVTGNVFDPAVAGLGEKIITYTYTNPETNYTKNCTFVLAVNDLPLTQLVQDLIVTQDYDTCFAAMQSITIAGNGTSVVVEPEGSLHVAAAQNILIKDGTWVMPGAHAHFRIEKGNNFCINPTPVVAVVDSVPSDKSPAKNQLSAATLSDQEMFKIYPNPTNGRFNLEITGSTGSVIVEIFKATGELVFERKLLSEQLCEFDLSTFSRGIYIVRITNDLKTSFRKLILK